MQTPVTRRQTLCIPVAVRPFSARTRTADQIKGTGKEGHLMTVVVSKARVVQGMFQRIAGDSSSVTRNAIFMCILSLMSRWYLCVCVPHPT